MVLTRGFAGRRRGARDPRLPPGQFDADMHWPVLHTEVTPSIDTAGWVSGLTLLAEDQLGFWEQRGYHDRGDPWLEQRYQGD
jgi:hypothetical protein